MQPRVAKQFLGYQEVGYTAPAVGATAPVHVHDYSLYLEREDGEVAFRGGCAYPVADHSHRITLESLMRGETEASDGHLHKLMTAQQVGATLLAAGVDAMLLWDKRDEAILVVQLEDAKGASEVEETFRQAGFSGQLVVIPKGEVWLEAKEGRVLSQRNFEKLKGAYTAIGEVLEAAQRREEDRFDAAALERAFREELGRLSAR